MTRRYVQWQSGAAQTRAVVSSTLTLRTYPELDPYGLGRGNPRVCESRHVGSIPTRPTMAR